VEVTIVVLVVLAVGALYGVGGYLLRDFGKQVLNRDTAAVGADLQARQEATLADARTELDRLKADLHAATTEGDAQLGRLRQRREAAQAELDAALVKAREELARAERIRQGAEQAKEQASAAAVAAAPEGPDVLLATRVAIEQLETLIELYARLARVETALAQLTTPILLPGEPYEAPEEFLPDALRWDNWKDVGETAYALGEYLTENRLRISAATARELEAGVTALRIALTRSIYPNLSPAPTEEQDATLRSGLDVLAQTLPRMRGLLEDDYRALTGTGDAARAKSPGPQPA
jgi:leucyl aminopeptidase (aminopeptidase T)